MAIAFRSAGTVGTSTGGAGSVTLGTPAGVLSTDIVVAVVTLGGTAANTVAPAGWTLAKGQDNAGDGSTVVVYWALGNVASYVFSNTLTIDTMTGVAAAYSGVNTTTPMDATAVGQNNVASATVTAPSITTVTAGAQVVFFGAPYDGARGNTGTWTTVFGTVRANGGIRGATQDTTDVVLADAAQAVAGASGAKTETYSISLASKGVLAALRPASTFHVDEDFRAPYVAQPDLPLVTVWG